MLESFRRAKEAEVATLREQSSTGTLPPPYRGSRPSLIRAIRDKGPGALVAEYKRASPSKGVINLEFGPEEIASMYKEAGAAALSVLTEKDHFQGSLDYLFRMQETGLPMLRKDFLFDPLQIIQTAATPASALLLIVRMLPSSRVLAGLIQQAQKEGLEVVVEIFDTEDLKLAKQAGARIIQVNNRDLDTLTTDLENSLSLAPNKEGDETWIAASGIYTPREVQTMAEAGYDAILVGTSLMEQPHPGNALKNLVDWRKHSA